MRVTQWALLFYIVFIAYITVSFLRSDKVDKAGVDNIEYANKLTAACHSAIDSADMGSLTGSGKTRRGLWTDLQKRKEVLDTFYRTLGLNFMRHTEDDDLRIAVPITILIDNDGYYINYNALFNKDEVGSDLNEYEEVNQLSSIMTWAEDIYGYNIRYCLDDYIYVTTPAGARYEGSRSKVIQNLIEEEGISPTSNLILYLKGNTELNHRKYLDHKADLIVDSIQKTLQYYVNEYNYATGLYGDGYSMVLPNVSTEDWHRLLARPTFVAFMQGRNTDTGKVIINTFAYAGGELIKADKYYVTPTSNPNMYMYHSVNNSLANGEMTQAGLANLGAIYDSMADCLTSFAKDKKNVEVHPCPNCIREEID